MGSAIFDSIHKKYPKHHYHIIDPIYQNKAVNVNIYNDFNHYSNNKSDIIFLGVKPQTLPNISNELTKICTKNNILISMLAGISTSQLSNIIGSEKKILRIMPNMAAINSNSTTSCFFNKNINQDEIKAILPLLKSFGSVEKLISEEDMHISTIINGGGMAFFALIMSYFKKSAKIYADHLSDQQIHNLFYHTLENFLEMNISEDKLIEKICSKKGTTEAVIESFNKQKLENIINNALKAGVKRSKNLSQ